MNLLAPLTELDEGVRPHGAADALGLVGDDELLLQLVQEAERQHVGVVGRAHHHVADAQRARETEIERRGRGGNLCLSERTETTIKRQQLSHSHATERGRDDTQGTEHISSKKRHLPRRLSGPEHFSGGGGYHDDILIVVRDAKRLQAAAAKMKRKWLKYRRRPKSVALKSEVSPPRRDPAE